MPISIAGKWPPAGALARGQGLEIQRMFTVQL
jgi:hypothetical protein